MCMGRMRIWYCKDDGSVLSEFYVFILSPSLIDIYILQCDCSRLTSISVWHPLQGPLVDWPLALCDGSTVDFENDTMAGDIVDKEVVFENTQVHFNAKQRWYYLSNQIPEELL